MLGCLLNMTSQLGSMILLAKLLLLSPLTSVFRIISGNYISAEDTLMKNTKVGETPAIKRIRNAQRNDIENIFTICAVWYLHQNHEYSSKWILIVVVLRVLHTVFYFLGTQPWRGICFAVPSLMTLYMIKAMHDAAENEGNNFNAIITILLAKNQMNGFLVGMTRKIKKAPHSDVPEDLSVVGIKKAPTENDELVERLNLMQSKDIYNHMAVIVLAIMVKDMKLMETQAIFNVLQFYAISRVAHTVSIVIALPSIMKLISYVFGIYYILPLFNCWGFTFAPEGWTKMTMSKETMIAILMLKNLAVCILEQMYNILNGKFDISEDQLLHPEQHNG